MLLMLCVSAVKNFLLGTPDYWTFSKIEIYKVFKNLVGLGTKQKFPVV
jgi:hypothetical protein